MRMAVVLPKTQVEIYYQRFTTVFENEFAEIETEYIFYKDYKEAPGLIKDRQRDFDAIIFAGSASYFYTESQLKQETIWLYLPREGGAIYRALLLAYRRGWDITRLSFDTYEPDMLREAYEELGYDARSLNIHLCKGNLRSPEYNRFVLDFHQNLLAAGRVSGCITRLTTVANMMETQGIPFIFAHPTIDTVREQISFAQKLAVARRDSWGQIAVMLVNVAMPLDYSVLVSADYSIEMDRLRMANHVHRFANRIRGMAMEQGASAYVIVSTMELLEAQTEVYRSLPLIDWLEKECPYTISVGIGCGESVYEAHRMAALALRKCTQRKRSCAFVQFPDGTGLFIRRDSSITAERSVMDEWQETAVASGLSVSTIYRLAELINRKQTDTMTAQEIADGLHINRRSADRLIEKLEAAGRASVTGRELSGKKGRPTRIVQLFLKL